ncbi:MAG: metallophosphoesterase [Bacteroidales bacterium]|nr:metallophosphoesterase [Bacteroidales bacterium]
MKSYQFLIFFSIVLLIYSLVNYYIYIRGIQALPQGTSFKNWYPWIFLFVSASYIISRLMERVWISPLSNIFTFVGSFWLALMIYFLMAVLVIDILRLILYFLPQPAILANNYVEFKKYLFIAVVGIVGIVVLLGHINALNPRVKRIDIHINKKAGEMKTLHIAAASDIHMGTLVGPRRTAKLVQMLNDRHADVILLAGDIVDEDLAPVIHNDLGRSLVKLKAPLGVFAITGNHEYIGGAEAAVKYLQDHGITMLRDTSLKINGSFYLAGRNDRDSKRFSKKERKGLDKVLEGVDLSFPVIMMDHQPFNLQQVVDAGVDFQLSGHTHHGQLWPFNYITTAMYEVSWGFKKKGNSNFYVSSGYGGWGPPVRTGNRPEILDIYITFN